jgi:hypothetical protein
VKRKGLKGVAGLNQLGPVHGIDRDDEMRFIAELARHRVGPPSLAWRLSQSATKRAKPKITLPRLKFMDAE